MNTRKQITVHIASDKDMNQAFINAWHQAEKGKSQETEEHLYFDDAATLLRILSNRRLTLLSILLSLGTTTIRALSKELKRNYRNVYDDVQALNQAGLIGKTPEKKIFVPWQKIITEIDLAA